MKNYLNEYATDISNAFMHTQATDKHGGELEIGQAFEYWTDTSKRIRDNNGTFFFIGNGASATIGEHMSHDCFKNADMRTQTCSETSHITAVANDMSYEDVFSYRINKTASAKDMLIAISSSGNSPNIIKAIYTARNKGVFVTSITGMSRENKARKLGDLNFYIPLKTYGMVESAHAMLLHCWLDLFLDKYMGGRH